MFRAVFVTALLAASYGFYIEHPGPRYPPTKGEIWPMPQSENKSSTYFTILPQHFVINVTQQKCPLLERAVARYSRLIARLQRLVARSRRVHSRRWVGPAAAANGTVWQGRLEALNVALTRPCEEYPHLDMDESYRMTVAKNATLTSGSVWGILRGLESFSQLLYLTDDYAEIRVNETTIVDFPRYAHRGLLLDTSRHFISMSNILTTLDAMAYNKMNVFHWHIVDDQSFPYRSAKFPDLSARGAYHPRAVYSPADVQRVVGSARDRGIRVVPEFDVPGHTRSWGEAYPALLTKCFSKEGKYLGLGPMNPIKNQTYKFLRDLMEEVTRVFPDQYLHIGGDEVDHDCWQYNPDIEAYMKAHNISMASELHSLFMGKVLPQLANGTKPIVWQEVVDDGVKLPEGSLVQIWKTGSVWEILRIIGSGSGVVYSTCWYLDQLSNGGDWREFYDCDPRALLPRHSGLAERIVGGEACMWGEVVDDDNVISRVWPRASAVAERLWSAEATRAAGEGAASGEEETGETASEEAAAAAAAESGKGKAEEHLFRRLEEHACRMMRRGVRAQPPTGPGFCLTL